MSHLATACVRLHVAGALALTGQYAFAHGGHSTPAGVSPSHHLHLSAGTVVSTEWLLATALVVVSIGALALRRHLKRRSSRRARN